MISSTTRLSDYYTVGDLSITSTGIANLPTENELDSLKKLASVLDILKRQLGNFRIASGYRSPLVNAAVGGSSTSRHMKGEAVDIIPYTKTAEKYWTEILADANLRNKLGEISFKKPQGSIHLSIPFVNSYGAYVIGSARLAEGSPMIYRSISATKVNSYISKYNIAPTKQPILSSVAVNLTQAVTLATKSTLGLSLLVFGAGSFILSLVKRIKK